jgi:ferritin-like metal-binding protein YciE
MNTLEDLFLDSLADMYYAENQLTKALPKMAKAATHDDLRGAFEAHLVETEGHVQKVEEVFAAFGKKPKSKKCPAILGIIKEADEIASENKKSPTINAALIFAGQKAEHYEIASYGGLRDWAKLLGNEDAADILDEILDEEKAADSKLSALAEEHCNEAAKSGEAQRKTPKAVLPALPLTLIKNLTGACNGAIFPKPDHACDPVFNFPHQEITIFARKAKLPDCTVHRDVFS